MHNVKHCTVSVFSFQLMTST